MTRSDIGQHPMLVAKPVSDTVQVSLFRWRSGLPMAHIADFTPRRLL